MKRSIPKSQSKVVWRTCISGLEAHFLARSWPKSLAGLWASQQPPLSFCPVSCHSEGMFPWWSSFHCAEAMPSSRLNVMVASKHGKQKLYLELPASRHQAKSYWWSRWCCRFVWSWRHQRSVHLELLLHLLRWNCLGIGIAAAGIKSITREEDVARESFERSPSTAFMPANVWKQTGAKAFTALYGTAQASSWGWDLQALGLMLLVLGWSRDMEAVFTL